MNLVEAETILSYDQDNNAQTVQRYNCHVYHREVNSIAHLPCLESQHRNISLPIALYEHYLSILLNCRKNTNP